MLATKLTHLVRKAMSLMAQQPFMTQTLSPPENVAWSREPAQTRQQTQLWLACGLARMLAAGPASTQRVLGSWPVQPHLGSVPVATCPATPRPALSFMVKTSRSSESLRSVPGSDSQACDAASAPMASPPPPSATSTCVSCTDRSHLADPGTVGALCASYLCWHLSS